MITVEADIVIDAPIELCFDLARDMAIHKRTAWKHTKEEIVDGVKTGLIGLGESVTFEATHLGVRQRLTSKVVTLDRPYLFIDEMQEGAFRFLRHTHIFEEVQGKTRMSDIVEFAAPYGPIGWVVERLVLRTYLASFLKHRNQQLKQIAEKEHPS
ncbi:hypothetical protein XYCOK13_24810 [Xylanibacillus composti]|uniref:Cell division protein n=1 Tax=Xylanibacillus composti TaxID=1572762 RepID=A0A8J4H522_9BACL|nr:SRPBCC family protein [Xylanibacillus composti]GIQ69657.1 hypothetical protein XYCOK13_24810 [Xylanibacillus composti]